MELELRDYQEACITGILASYEQNKSGSELVVLMPLLARLEVAYMSMVGKSQLPLFKPFIGQNISRSYEHFTELAKDF